MGIRKTLTALAMVVAMGGGAMAMAHLLADAPKPGGPYANDFEKTEPGKPPADMLILSGTFEVKVEGKNHFLELAGIPLDVDGLLFGAEGNVASEVKAKICGTCNGKLHPEFGVGANDAGGYKLILLPGPGMLEIRKNEESLVKVDYPNWKSGEWTNFRLRVAPAASGKWKIEGKAWPASGKEPEKWLVSCEEDEAPAAGRASIWGIPYSDMAIQFDDLQVTPVDVGK